MKLRSKDEQRREGERIRKRLHRRHKGRIREITIPKWVNDPMFLAHAVSALNRYLELQYPAEYKIAKDLASEMAKQPVPEVWGLERQGKKARGRRSENG